MEIKAFYDSLGQDYETVLKRMMGNEAFLYSLLQRFAADRMIEELETAVRSRDAEKIFNQVHALKGVAENLGLKPLYETAFKLVEITRKGSVEGTEEAFAEVRQAHAQVLSLLEKVTPGSGSGSYQA